MVEEQGEQFFRSTRQGLGPLPSRRTSPTLLLQRRAKRLSLVIRMEPGDASVWKLRVTSDILPLRGVNSSRTAGEKGPIAASLSVVCRAVRLCRVMSWDLLPQLELYQQTICSKKESHEEFG